MSEVKKEKYVLDKERLKKLGVVQDDFVRIGGVSEITASHQYNGYRETPLNTVIKLAWEYHTNVSFLLGLTDKDLMIDSPEVSMRLARLIKLKNLSTYTMEKDLGITRQTLYKYGEGPIEEKYIPIGKLIKISNYLDVSIDCLLGLTAYLTWEEKRRFTDFSFIKAGEAFSIEFPDHAINCLMNIDGNSIILPDGTKTGLDNEYLAQNIEIIKLVKPQKRKRG